MPQNQLKEPQVFDDKCTVIVFDCPKSKQEQTQQASQASKTTLTVAATLSCVKIFHVISYVILGGLDTIIYKYQNTTIVDGKKFQHPFIQTFIMEFAMSLPLIWVVYQKFKKQLYVNVDPSKKMMTTWRDYLWILVPSLCDLIGSTLQFFSLLFIDSSIYQMMRGGSIIFTALFSKILFKKIFLKYKYLGLLLSIIGLVLVGLSPFLFIGSSNSANLNMQYVSIGLLVICMALNGGHYTSEEYIYSKYNIHPCELLGTQAFYGAVIYMTILLPIFCNVECNFPNGVGCVKVGDTYYFDNLSQYFSEVTSNGWLLAFVFFGIASKCIYNLNGIFTTKYFSSLTRSIAGALRTLVTWMVGLIVTAIGARQWESLEYRTCLLMTGGYIFLFAGNLIYNGVIKVPYFKREADIAVENKQQTLKVIQVESDNLKKIESKLSCDPPLSIKTACN
ncbi:hypothetical protein ABPG74_009972 [Tetrahymena malaccensis]